MTTDLKPWHRVRITAGQHVGKLGVLEYEAKIRHGRRHWWVSLDGAARPELLDEEALEVMPLGFAFVPGSAR